METIVAEYNFEVGDLSYAQREALIAAIVGAMLEVIGEHKVLATGFVGLETWTEDEDGE